MRLALSRNIGVFFESSNARYTVLHVLCVRAGAGDRAKGKIEEKSHVRVDKDVRTLFAHPHMFLKTIRKENII